MADVGLDSVRDLSARERWGVTMELHRLAIVSGLDPASHDSGEEYQVLFDALDALGLSALSALPTDPNLILVERNPRLFDGENDKVEVELAYIHFSEAGTQLLNNSQGNPIVQFTTSLREVETNKDRDGNPVLLQHKYSSDYKTRKDDKSDPQGGVFRVREVVRTAVVDGIIDFSEGDIHSTAGECQFVVDNIAGRINTDDESNTWPSGSEVGMWLCTVADFTQLDKDESSSSRAIFHFEFEYNPDGWQPEIVFIDPETGKPVADPYTTDTYAAAGLDYPGIRTVTKYKTASFRAFFQSLSDYTPPD